jgi:predicted DNA-binding transcriptional regulator
MYQNEFDYDLFGGAPPHAKNRQTSEQAAFAILPHVSKLADKVYAFIKESKDGVTCQEAEHALNMAHQTCSPRIRELNLKGMVRDSGKRRRTTSRRWAIVWITTEKPRELIGRRKPSVEIIQEQQAEIDRLKKQVAELEREGK